MPSLFIFLPETAVTVFALTDMEFLVYPNCLTVRPIKLCDKKTTIRLKI